MSTDGHRYAPEPSFVDDQPIPVDVEALPGWLRELSERTPNTNFVHPDAAEAQGHVEEASPGWLQETDAEEPPPPAASTPDDFSPQQDSSEERGPDDPLSFITEDDLPEWLRAIGDEPGGSASPGESAPAWRDTPSEPEIEPELQPEPERSSLRRPVPTVSRAWLTRPIDVDQERSERTRSDFVPARVSIPETQAEAPPIESVVESAEPEPEPDAREPATRSRSRRLLWVLVFLIVIVALLAAVFFVTALP